LGDLPYSCGSPRNPSPAGGLRLPAGKHTSILTYFQTIVNKKNNPKKVLYKHINSALLWHEEIDEWVLKAATTDLCE
jgi:hypothetical protein